MTAYSLPPAFELAGPVPCAYPGISRLPSAAAVRFLLLLTGNRAVIDSSFDKDRAFPEPKKTTKNKERAVASSEEAVDVERHPVCVPPVEDATSLASFTYILAVFRAFSTCQCIK